MKNFKKFLESSFFYWLLILLVWQILHYFGCYSELFFPSPLQVILFFYDGFIHHMTLWCSILISFKRLFMGYFMSVVFGIPLGMLCSTLKIFDRILGKMALSLQTLPSICWVPLTLFWFGQNDKAIIFVICMGSIWGLILGTKQSVQLVPEIYVRAAYTMGARGLMLWRTVIFPAALPLIVSSMKQSWAFAWRSLLSAEIYISTVSGLGLGQLLHYGREMQAMDQVVSVIFIIVIIGVFIERYMFIPAENYIVKRWGK